MTSPANGDLLDPADLARIDNYSLLARTVVEGFLSGLHRSLFHGFGSEFLQYRSHAPGEDVKLVDWKVYARRDELVAKVYQEETNLNCHILVDASSSHAYRGGRAPCTKFRYASMVAACLAYLANRQGDNVGLYLYSDRILDAVEPGGRSGQLERVMRALGAAAPRESGVAADHLRAIEFLEHRLRSRGLAILISDLCEAEDVVPAQLGRLRFRHCEGLVIQVLDPDEIALPRGGAARFIDSETGEERVTSPRAAADGHDRDMADAILRAGRLLRDAQVDHLTVTTEESLGHALARFLHRREGMG